MPGEDRRAEGASQIDTENLMRNRKEGNVCKREMKRQCVSDVTEDQRIRGFVTTGIVPVPILMIIMSTLKIQHRLC